MNYGRSLPPIGHDAVGTTRSEDESSCNVESLLQQAINYQRQGDARSAELAYRRVLHVRPDHPGTIHFLGMLAFQMGRQDEGLELVLRSVELAPGNASFRANLGALYARASQAENAIAAVREAIRLSPRLSEAHQTLGLMLESIERPYEAAIAYREALALSPGSPDLQAHLVRAVARSGGIVNPATIPLAATCDIAAHTFEVIASIFEHQGRLEDAIYSRRRFLALRPDSPTAHSALLYLLLHDSRISADELFMEHLRWAKKHARPPASFPLHPNDRSRGRRLRVGYVSPDFRQHPIPRFILPLLSTHDRNHFTVICYSDTLQTDEITRSVRAVADEWRETASLTNPQFCALVRQDQIDILVDLCGHMTGNRMPAFAGKPAPVQITTMYLNSTGLTAMDGKITDAWANPVEVPERYHTEELLRLPYSGWCYRPPAAPPPIKPLPALSLGYVTFGSLNRQLKLSAATIEMWARVLQTVRNSRLLALTEHDAGEEGLREDFARHGIADSRINAVRRGSYQAYLETAYQIDIALDTFPFNGLTTSCEMILMGVPVITLAGDKTASRMGRGLLANLGLIDLVASTPGQFVEIANALAADLGRLVELRSTLRKRLLSSILVDEKTHTTHAEAAYRQMWSKWCESGS